MGVLGGVRSSGDSAFKVSLTSGSVGQPGANWVRCRVLGGFGAEMAPGWIGHVQGGFSHVSRSETHARVEEKMPEQGYCFSGERSEPDFFLNAREQTSSRRAITGTAGSGASG